MRRSALSARSVRSGRGQVGEVFVHVGLQSVSSTKGTGLLESTPRSEPQPPSSTLDFVPRALPRRAAAVFVRGGLDQLALRHRGADDRAHVDLSPSFRQQGPPSGLRFMESYRWQGHIGVARLHKVAGWPAHEDARHVTRVILDEQPALRASEIRAQRRGPVPQSEQMNPVRSQGALFLGQEGQTRSACGPAAAEAGSCPSCSFHTAIGGRPKAAVD